MLANRSSVIAVIVCHPWGPLGGSMHDPTVVSVVGLMADAGLTTLRFNFRYGIGRGHGAGADLRAACAAVMSLDSPPEALVLVGYSYGSLVVADVAPTMPNVCAFAMIAPPLGFEHRLFCGRTVSKQAQRSDKHKLAFIGANDQFCTPSTFHEYTRYMSPTSTSVKIILGESVPCGDHGCHKAHQSRVDHFSIRAHVDKMFVPWLEETFACSFSELAHNAKVPRHGAEEQCQ